MTAAVGIEIDMSGRATEGMGGAGRGMNSAGRLNPAQNGTVTGAVGASSVTGGTESFQQRWQAVLASLGGDAGHQAAGGGTESASGSAEGLTRATASIAVASENSVSGGVNRAQNIASNSRTTAAPQDLKPGAEQIGTSSAADVKGEAPATTHSREPAETGMERKRGKESSSESTTAAMSTSQVESLAAALATAAPAGNKPDPVAETENVRYTGSSLNSLTQSSSEASSLPAVQQETFAAQPAHRTGIAVAHAGTKPGSAASKMPQDGFPGDSLAQEGAGPDEAASSVDVRVASTQHVSVAANDVTTAAVTSETRDNRQTGVSAQAESLAGKSVDSVAQSQPAQAVADSAQAPALAASASASSKEPVASTRGRKTGETGTLSVHAVAAPAAGTIEASMLARNAAGVPAGSHAGDQALAAAAAKAPVTGSHETFAALDADPAKGMPSWIHAGAQQAEAGYQDPALGWVGVRADLGAGGIHASIVPGSADAAQALGGHLAGLNAHLAAEHIPVDSLRMAAATSSASLGVDTAAAQSGQSGSGQQGQGQPAQQGATSLGSVGMQSMGRGSAEADKDGVNGSQAAKVPVEHVWPNSATHISVVA